MFKFCPTAKMEKTRPPTTIQDLPNELLGKILGVSSLRDDLEHIQHVCKRWRSLINETIGFAVSVSAITQHHPELPMIQDSTLEVIEDIGVKTLFIDLSTPMDLEEEAKEGKQLPSFKYPHLLRHIYVNGGLTSDIFHALVDTTLNLTVLEMNLQALHQLKPADLQSIRFPLLKVLGVRKCMKSICKGFDDALGLPNLQVLLKGGDFPSLCQLDLRFPIQKFGDFGTIQALLTFLLRHAHLRELYLLMDFPVMIERTQGYQEDMENAFVQLKQLSKKQSSLNVIEIQAIRLHTIYPHLAIWKEFLTHQRNLKSLTLRIGSIPKEVLECICVRNKGTLENLFLYKLNETGETQMDSILDCVTFSNLHRLHTLYALGSDRVINAMELPTSLHTIFLTGAIRTEEVEHILLELPKASFISLRNAFDKREGCGVSMALLQEFIGRRKARRLILNGSCYSEPFPQEGMSNGDPCNPTMLTEFDHWDPDQTYLDWELGKDHYYVNKYY